MHIPKFFFISFLLFSLFLIPPIFSGYGSCYSHKICDAYGSYFDCSGNPCSLLCLNDQINTVSTEQVFHIIDTLAYTCIGTESITNDFSIQFGEHFRNLGYEYHNKTATYSASFTCGFAGQIWLWSGALIHDLNSALDGTVDTDPFKMKWDGQTSFSDCTQQTYFINNVAQLNNLSSSTTTVFNPIMNTSNSYIRQLTEPGFGQNIGMALIQYYNQSYPISHDSQQAIINATCPSPQLLCHTKYTNDTGYVMDYVASKLPDCSPHYLYCTDTSTTTNPLCTLGSPYNLYSNFTQALNWYFTNIKQPIFMQWRTTWYYGAGLSNSFTGYFYDKLLLGLNATDTTGTFWTFDGDRLLVNNSQNIQYRNIYNNWALNSFKGFYLTCNSPVGTITKIYNDTNAQTESYKDDSNIYKLRYNTKDSTTCDVTGSSNTYYVNANTSALSKYPASNPLLDIDITNDGTWDYYHKNWSNSYPFLVTSSYTSNQVMETNLTDKGGHDSDQINWYSYGGAFNGQSCLADTECNDVIAYLDDTETCNHGCMWYNGIKTQADGSANPCNVSEHLDDCLYNKATYYGDCANCDSSSNTCGSGTVGTLCTTDADCGGAPYICRGGYADYKMQCTNETSGQVYWRPEIATCQILGNTTSKATMSTCIFHDGNNNNSILTNITNLTTQFCGYNDLLPLYPGEGGGPGLIAFRPSDYSGNEWQNDFNGYNWALITRGIGINISGILYTEYNITLAVNQTFNCAGVNVCNPSKNNVAYDSSTSYDTVQNCAGCANNSYSCSYDGQCCNNNCYSDNVCGNPDNVSCSTNTDCRSNNCRTDVSSGLYAQTTVLCSSNYTFDIYRNKFGNPTCTNINYTNWTLSQANISCNYGFMCNTDYVLGNLTSDSSSYPNPCDIPKNVCNNNILDTDAFETSIDHGGYYCGYCDKPKTKDTDTFWIIAKQAHPNSFPFNSKWCEEAQATATSITGLMLILLIIFFLFILLIFIIALVYFGSIGGFFVAVAGFVYKKLKNDKNK